MKKSKAKSQKNKRQILSFCNQTHARDDSARNDKINRRLNHLYTLADKYPEDVQLEEEIEELERELSN